MYILHSIFDRFWEEGLLGQKQSFEVFEHKGSGFYEYVGVNQGAN